MGYKGLSTKSQNIYTWQFLLTEENMDKKTSIILVILGTVEKVIDLLLTVLEEIRNWAETWDDHLAASLLLLMLIVPYFLTFGMKLIIYLLKTLLEELL